MQRAVGALLGQQLGSHRACLGPGPDLREVLLEYRVAPLVGELLEREADGAPEGALDSAGKRALQDGADGLVAPALADVGPERVPEAIGEILVRIERHLLDGGQLPFERGISQPHGRFGIDGAYRYVFRHYFREPERGIDGNDGRYSATGPSPLPGVILE